ncbi:MAG: DUF2029 domain-containing protein [Hyphomicrobiales bacterium]|nr:DUF2029 domain-containing protein [Hyphomicrobiales bacterium]
MQKILEATRTGDWLTVQRLRAYSLILLALALAAIAAIAVQSHDLLMPNDNPVGADFAEVWVAGQEALQGHPAAPFDMQTHIAAQHAVFGPKAAVYGWHYPPYFLIPAQALARLPYVPALVLWQALTFAFYLFVIATIARRAPGDMRLWMLAAVAFPAVLVNVGHGQNGFLTAGLMAAGLMALDRRPWLAGALLALLAYKPNFAIVLPVALLLHFRWRAIVSGALVGALATLATFALFGVEAWRAFFANLDVTRTIVIEQGAAGFEKIQSVFAGVRLLGGSIGAAYGVQSVATLATLGALAWVWRSSADMRVKIAAALIATQLTTPYCLDYDMMTLGPALALLASHGLERGFQPYEKSGLALGFMTPLIARPFAIAFGVPFGAPATILLFVVALRTAIAARESRPTLVFART